MLRAGTKYREVLYCPDRCIPAGVGRRAEKRAGRAQSAKSAVRGRGTFFKLGPSSKLRTILHSCLADFFDSTDNEMSSGSETETTLAWGALPVEQYLIVSAAPFSTIHFLNPSPAHGVPGATQSPQHNADHA